MHRGVTAHAMYHRLWRYAAAAAPISLCVDVVELLSTLGHAGAPDA